MRFLKYESESDMKSYCKGLQNSITFTKEAAEKNHRYLSFTISINRIFSTPQQNSKIFFFLEQSDEYNYISCRKVLGGKKKKRSRVVTVSNKRKKD